MVPEQKLRSVNALKVDGEAVAMTGDGVNDAPALVQLDDDFATIVHAVCLGRVIFGSLHKAMAYSLAVHIPIAGLSLISPLLGWPPILAPVYIVFLERIINPSCAIVFEAEPAEHSVMQRPPRLRCWATRCTKVQKHAR